MKQLFEALTALLKVKTIVTLVIIVVLAVLSLNGSCLLYTSAVVRGLWWEETDDRN